MAIGTLPYMAPEQARGTPDQIDARSDLFSLAATAFRMLAGRPVHARKKPGELLVAMATQVAPRLATVAPHVPPALSQVIDVGLAYSKDKRYPDARTMRADLMAVRHGRPPPFADDRLARRVPEDGTVPDYPFEVATQLDPGEADETLHWGTLESVPPPIDSAPGASAAPPPEPTELTTVPFGPVPEVSAMGDDETQPRPSERRREMATQPIGTFSDPEESES
jgi:serine/threonine protein kinase